MSNRVISDPRIMFGKPVIAGTRITVEHILRCLAAGEAPDEIVADYPLDQDRILLTEDNDFGELVVRFKLPTHGIVRVDLKDLDKASQIERLLASISGHSDRLRNALVTVEPNRTRHRPIAW